MTEHMSRRSLMKTLGVGALAMTFGCSAEGQKAESTAPGTTGDYTLPPLPYAYDALAPGIEANVLRVHHDKHHAGYVKGLNATLEKLESARRSGDMSAVKALSRDLAFNGSGHVLHALYWVSMKPGGTSAPGGALGAMLKRDFGSFDAFAAQFVAASNAVEGSGWGVLAYEPLGRRLVVLQAEKHQNLTIWGVTPLMVCDVWEHAYYDQYQNRRADYVDAFWKLVDWPGVANRLNAAMA